MPWYDDETSFAPQPATAEKPKAGWWDDASNFAGAPATPGAVDDWPDSSPPRETTWGEFAGGLASDAAQGIMRAPKAIADLGVQAERMPGAFGLLGALGMNPSQSASDFFQRGIDSAESMKPEAYKAEANQGFVSRDAEGNMDGLQMPSSEAALGTLLQSLPQIPQFIADRGGR